MVLCAEASPLPAVWGCAGDLDGEDAELQAIRRAVLLRSDASSLVATYLDPGVWRQYQVMMTSSGISGEYIACFSVAFRFAIHREWVWLQYVPAVVGSIWAIGYYWRRA